MFLASFPAGPWQTNCYVLADRVGAECVIVDPGFTAASGVAELIAEHSLEAVAVLLTHGHLDHTFSVLPVCRSYAASCWVHPDDRDLLVHPWRALGPDTHGLVRQLIGREPSFTEPDDVRELVHGAEVELAGLTLGVRHAPGHTPGSVMYTLGGPDDEDPQVLAGDVLFAGSIGRTDLPGGSHGDMLESLRSQVLTLPDRTRVLPGHGPPTTIGRERVHNPYLRLDRR